MRAAEHSSGESVLVEPHLLAVGVTPEAAIVRAVQVGSRRLGSAGRRADGDFVGSLLGKATRKRMSCAVEATMGDRVQSSLWRYTGEPFVAARRRWAS